MSFFLLGDVSLEHLPTPVLETSYMGRMVYGHPFHLVDSLNPCGSNMGTQSNLWP